MKNVNILFVDDDEQIQDVFFKLLSLKYQRVYQAISGQTAIDLYLLNKDIIDIVILDMTLGIGLDGYQVCKKLNEINPNVKIVICSGYSKSVNSIHELINNYGCKYLSKPIDNKTLYSIIDNLPLF